MTKKQLIELVKKNLYQETPDKMSEAQKGWNQGLVELAKQISPKTTIPTYPGLLK